MQATLNDVPFRINPQSVRWDYTMKYNSRDTVGGRVIQLFGVRLGDLTIEGVFGKGGPAEQEGFFNRIVDIIKNQTPLDPKANPNPVRFFWPQRSWDFTCYIRSISQPGTRTSIALDNETINPGYRLVLFIQEDNQNILNAVKDAATAAYINRLTAGMGWKQTTWNGPTGTAELQDSLHGQTVLQAIFNGSADRPTVTGTDAGTTPDQVFNGGTSSQASNTDDGTGD